MTFFPNSTALLRAVDYAILTHDPQRRKNATKAPYVTHPVRVAIRLQNAGIVDIDVLCAALLHDVLEDTKGTREVIERDFGAKVASIVGEVTDDKTLPVAERKRLQIKHAKTKSHEAKLVKLADKLDNCSDLLLHPPVSWSPERIQGYFIWSAAVVAELSGTSEALERQLQDIFASVVYDPETLEPSPVVPPEPLRSELLEKYYALLQEKETQNASSAPQVIHSGQAAPPLPPSSDE